MKNIFIALSLFLFASIAIAEQKDSNGGSGVAAEFMEAAHGLIARLYSKPIAEVDLKSFAAAVAETKVVPKKSLKLRGDAVDAINYPSRKLIEVSVLRWNKLTMTPWVKQQLVFHEYLGILGIDDTGYKVSRQILNSDLCSRTPGLIRSIEGTIRRNCDEITLKDLSYITDLIVTKLELFKASDFRDMMFMRRLQIISELPLITINKEFTKLLPAIFSLDVEAKEVVIVPGAFENSTLTFLQVANPQLIRGSLRGLRAEILMFTYIPNKNLIEKLEEELATEDYSCSTTDSSVPNFFNLACQKI